MPDPCKLVLVSGIFPPDSGGPATFIPALAKALAERGHCASVITLTDEMQPSLDEQFNFEITRILRRQSKIVRLPKTIRTIVAAAKERDLIYSNGLFLESAIAARLARKPLIIKVVGDKAWEWAKTANYTQDTLDEFQQNRHSPRVEMVKHIIRWTVAQANLIITPSIYLQKIVQGWGVPPNKTEVVYNAVKPVRLPVQPPPPLPSFDGQTIVTVCRLVPWKGIDGIIRVLTNFERVRLVIVGDGEERTRLEELARKEGVLSRVIFTGFVPAESVAFYLSKADVFVLNSEYEGLPHVVLEAIRANLPIVATRVGGTPEVVQQNNNGLLVAPNNDEELRIALQTALNGQLAADSGLPEKFQFATMIAETERLIWRTTK